MFVSPIIISLIAHVREKGAEILLFCFSKASADFYFLSELIKDYIGRVGAVKDAFQVLFVFLPISQPFSILRALS